MRERGADLDGISLHEAEIYLEMGRWDKCVTSFPNRMYACCR